MMEANTITLKMRTCYVDTLNTANVMNGTWYILPSSSFIFPDWWTKTASNPTHIVCNASPLRSHWHAESMYSQVNGCSYGQNQSAIDDRGEQGEKIAERRSSGPCVFERVRYCAFDEVNRVYSIRLCAFVSSVDSWLTLKLVWGILNVP